MHALLVLQQYFTSRLYILPAGPGYNAPTAVQKLRSGAMPPQHQQHVETATVRQTTLQLSWTILTRIFVDISH